MFNQYHAGNPTPYQKIHELTERIGELENRIDDNDEEISALMFERIDYLYLIELQELNEADLKACRDKEVRINFLMAENHDLREIIKLMQYCIDNVNPDGDIPAKVEDNPGEPDEHQFLGRSLTFP